MTEENSPETGAEVHHQAAVMNLCLVLELLTEWHVALNALLLIT